MKIKIFRSSTILITAGMIFLTYSCKMKQEQSVEGIKHGDNSIRLSDAQMRLANISTAEVREANIVRKLSLTGVLKVNEESAVTISSRVPGRIEKLFFRNTGETVNKGDKLYEFYSDVMVDAQREYYRLQSNNWNFTGRYEPSLILEDKLLLMGFVPSQIKQLGKDGKIQFRVTIFSPASGKIRAINVSEGQYVEEGQAMFELAEDKNLWVEAQVYPDEIQYLRTGMPATVIVPAAGDLPVECRINFINPSFETGRNVTLVRAEINNPDSRLHPGMFAILNVQTMISRGIVIPSSSVINGNGIECVWVMDEYGLFSERKVKTDLQSGDSVLVLSGLNEADIIVTTGAYLLNSEFILKKGSDHAGGEVISNTTMVE